MLANVPATKIRTHLAVTARVVVLSCAATILIGCQAGSRVREDDTEKLSPSQQLSDLETFGRVVASAHPYLERSDRQRSLKKALADCRRRLNKELTLGQFYRAISPVADVLEDDHTMIYSPEGRSISQQQRYAEGIYAWIKSTETVGSNNYRILSERGLCVLQFNTCGMPWEQGLYKTFFERVFKDISDHEVETLIIDARRNQGGYSGNASELLRYIADGPFRQYDRAERRICQESLEFYRKCDIDLVELLERDFNLGGLKVLPEGGLPAGTYLMEAKYLDPVDETMRFKGQTYVLIGPDLFSSGMLFANTVQQYKMAPLVGRKVRWQFGRQHLGDVLIGELPHSHLEYMVSTTIFTVSRPAGAKYITPDYETPTQESRSGQERDAVLEHAIELSEEMGHQ